MATLHLESRRIRLLRVNRDSGGGAGNGETANGCDPRGGARAGAGRLPRLRPGVGLNTHVLALRDNLATAPTKRVNRIDAHAGRVSSVAISPDGKWLLTGSADRAVKLFDLASGFEGREF